MYVYDKEETGDIYADFLDKIANSVFRESMKEIVNLQNNQVDPTKNSQEIALAMGQVLLDEIIDHTKDMDRNELIKLLAEVSISYATSIMQANPNYKLSIAIRNGLF